MSNGCSNDRHITTGSRGEREQLTVPHTHVHTGKALHRYSLESSTTYALGSPRPAGGTTVRDSSKTKTTWRPAAVISPTTSLCVAWSTSFPFTYHVRAGVSLLHTMGERHKHFHKRRNLEKSHTNTRTFPLIACPYLWLGRRRTHPFRSPCTLSHIQGGTRASLNIKNVFKFDCYPVTKSHASKLAPWFISRRT